MRILVTGGAGFIGSALCRYLIRDRRLRVVNFDKLTYAANLSSLDQLSSDPLYTFVKGDICDGAQVLATLREHRVDAIMHLAAESHVDRSIDGPETCLYTNVMGTFALLEAARIYWSEDLGGSPDFRFHHVSTDEVYGDLPFDDSVFTEQTPYAPSSPYSATKAASDHLVRAWHKTYGLPAIISNCSNNYGPNQFPEKLIPLMIVSALEGLPMPVYGTGENVRDWLHVEDHVRALSIVLRSGRVGETYNIGGGSERTNLQLVERICSLMDRRRPGAKPHRAQIEFVHDRPGHDRRYAIDASKIRRELNWCPLKDFDTGLSETVDWYLENEWWWRPLRDHNYDGRRLGALHSGDGAPECGS